MIEALYAQRNDLLAHGRTPFLILLSKAAQQQLAEELSPYGIKTEATTRWRPQILGVPFEVVEGLPDGVLMIDRDTALRLIDSLRWWART